MNSRGARRRVRLLQRELAVAVEVEGRLDRPGERPLVLVAPAAAVVELPLGRPATGAAAHHEDADRRLVGRLAAGIVGKPAREVLELLLEVALDAPDAVGPEVDLVAERRLAAHPDVAPGADHEPLRRAVLRRHRGKVVGVGPCPRVEPARRDRHRDVGVLIEVRGESHSIRAHHSS